VDPTYFDSPGGVLSPKRQYQLAHRASATAGGATFTPASNPAPGTVLFTTNVSWLNNTGVTQSVYAQMTQGPVRYQIDALKHLVIRYQWGTSFGVAPADPTLTEESRIRGLVDAGTTTVSSTNVAIYVLLEDRQPPISFPIGDLITLPAGQTVKARCQVSWQTDAWGLNWYSGYGDPIPHRIGKVGPVKLDLFSVPVIP
jgi:hypothetical protein